MRNREKWRLIIQEVKAHTELWRRGEGRKAGIITGHKILEVLIQI
jgi:hypothetical protein